MIEYLLSLSLLIAAILLIRGVFRKTVSPRAVYALWLVVVIRMLLPITLFEMDVNLPEFLQSLQTVQEKQPEQLSEDSGVSADVLEQSPVSTPMQTAPTVPSQSTSQTTPGYPAVITPITPETPVTSTASADKTPVIPDTQETTAEEMITPDETIPEVPKKTMYVNWKRTFDLVWFCGAVAASVWVLLTNITYSRQLKKNRVFHRTVRGTKVYISEYAGVPCIAGLIPSIYITPEAANGNSEALIIIHEHVHLRRGDHIWSIIRALALIVFWWNPLVWVAATVSKQDAELACDDVISSKMNDEGRLKYANILLDTIPQKHRYAVGLGSAPMKERILMLTKKQKNRWICLVLAIALALGAVICSFVSLNEKTDNSAAAKFVGIVEALPDKDPLIAAIGKGGTLNYFTFEKGLSFYCRDYSNNCEMQYMLELPDGYTDGNICFAYAGEVSRVGDGVGEIHFLVEAHYGGELKYLDCYFIPEDNFEPGGAIVLTSMKELTSDEANALRGIGSTLPSQDADMPLTPEEYSLLMKDHSETVSLYYSNDKPDSDFAKYFRITIGGHEAYVSTKNSAWIGITWAPQVYCMDIALPDMPADGIDDAVIILTTGTGSGVHTNEAHILNGADGTLRSFTDPYTVIENAISHDVTGKAAIVYLSDGKSVSLPDNAYFNQSYTFYIEDGCLYARVNIGYGVLQYLEKYFLIKYSENGIALHYTSEDKEPSADFGEEPGQGPFIGYVADAQTPWIELYTEKNGTYVGRIPYEIFNGWPATQRTGNWEAGYIDDYIHFYYAEFGDFRWAGVHIVDTVLGNGRKNIATSADGGETWNCGSYMDDYGGNHVVGMYFVSEKVAFMSFDPNNAHELIDGPEISRTIDGGKTWKRLVVSVPDSLKGKKLLAGTPIHEGDVIRYPIRHNPAHGSIEGETMYIISRDNGMTWEWENQSVLYPTDEEIFAEYEKATKIDDIFALSTSELVENVNTAVDKPIQIGDHHYFESKKYSSFDELRNELLTVFPEEITDEMLDTELIKNVDGKLYAVLADGGDSAPVSFRNEMEIIPISDTKLTLRVTVKITDYYLRTYGYYASGQIIDTVNVDFTYEKIGDNWVFTEFPYIRGVFDSKLREKYTEYEFDFGKLVLPAKYDGQFIFKTGEGKYLLTAAYDPHGDGQYSDDQVFKIWRIPLGEEIPQKDGLTVTNAIGYDDKYVYMMTSGVSTSRSVTYESGFDDAVCECVTAIVTYMPHVNGWQYFGVLEHLIPIEQNTIHQSILENKATVYSPDFKSDVLLSDYLKSSDLDISKYIVLNLDESGSHETILWLEKGDTEYLGFLILNNKNEKTYAHLLYYRQFSNLKIDGTFSFSSGVSNHGIGRLYFSGDTCTIDEIVYCESADGRNISYYVENQSVSKEIFDAYIAIHNQKASVSWFDYTYGT